MDIKTVTYQCPNCNAGLEFDEASGKLRCFYCDSEFTEAQIQDIFKQNEGMKLETDEPELTEQQKTTEEYSGESALYTCPNCGAGVICDTLTASTHCHFCHTPVILTGRLSGEFKPDMVIPFSVTREWAEDGFRQYIKGKFLLPKGFKSEAQIKNITALYVPYWLKSGLTNAHYTAEGKVVHSWTSGNTVYTNTKIYRVEREAEMAFIRVPCDGSRRIDDALMESIEPFDYKGLKPFSMSYLSGKAAEKYDVSAESASVRIDDRIRQAAKDVLKKTASQYSSLSKENCDISFRQQNCVYAMLPVWFLNYTYRGKDYAFVMNGQTGEKFGELPVSGLKRFLFGLGVFALSFVIAVLIGGACLCLG